MPRIVEVGGCVRDSLLGLTSKDIDFTFVLDDLSRDVTEGFTEMRTWMEKHGYEIFLATEEMFTIRAKFPKDHPNAGLVADFVMARRENGYIPGTRRPLLTLGTLEDDLIRRDFTLNAMARELDGTIIDLFGGKEDLAAGILRTPRDPNITLTDDPLRLLRALRFSVTKGFMIHEDIWEAVSTNPEILEKMGSVVSGQRIREELMRMMKHDTLATIDILNQTESRLPGFMKLVFSGGMWLKPTFEQV